MTANTNLLTFVTMEIEMPESNTSTGEMSQGEFNEDGAVEVRLFVCERYI
jgi:hypothetical protein